ncbi:hypothetical protein N8Z89_00195 [bacterium]|nr:hypothetical protein [bacterium]
MLSSIILSLAMNTSPAPIADVIFLETQDVQIASKRKRMRISEQNPENISKRKRMRISEQNPENISKRKRMRISEQNPERISKRKRMRINDEFNAIEAFEFIK